MILIIAEKPSVAQELAAIIGAKKREDGFIAGNGYYVSWCVGHLVSNAEPEQYDPALKQWTIETLPIIPEQWQTTILSRTKNQFYILKKLFDSKDVDEIICAGDCGREGELIFRLVYHQARCSKLVKRLWVSSLEEKELRRGLADLQPASNYDNLYQAALCRSRADWLVGMNLSRLYSLMYNHKLSVGRVQTPTVAMIVKRQSDIDMFVPRPYWQIVADLGGWKAFTTTDKLDQMKKIVDRCNHKPAYVSKVEQTKKTVSPPKLFSITSLQREANKLLGYTAQQTLTYLQSLYEKKLTTYPRTECEYLPSNMLDGLPEKLENVLNLSCIGDATKSNYDATEANYKRVINDSKITDHHAIIPTGHTDDNIPEPEKNILRIVAYRFLAAFAPAHEYLQTTVVLDIEGEPFKATGKAVTRPGYMEIINDMKCTLKGLNDDPTEKEEDETDGIPASLQEGQTINQDIAVFSVEKKTQPLRPFTDATLLSSMANVSKTIGNNELKAAIKDLGLGTGATRAAIIETIIKNGYVVRKGKNLLPTDDGKNLIDVVNEEIKQPEMTAEWENQLEQIAAGELSPDAFMTEITNYIKSLIYTLKKLGVNVDKKTFKPEQVIVGKCPRCGKNVVEYPKTFSCESGKDGCGFTMWKDEKFFTWKKKKLDKKIASTLLKSGKAKVKGLYSSKKDKTYDATVVLVDTGKFVNYKLEFDNAKK